ncbi:MAG: nucleotide pyrophosphohydrolase [Planctomycetota bacterium]
MNDQETTVAKLKELVRDFSIARDWEQFHHPKDLGVALAIEVGEILEHFRYRSNDQIREHLVQPNHKRELAHELADGLWLLLRLADVCGIDLSAALEEKVALAELKYPAERVRGLPHKYTFYQSEAEE